MDTLARAARRIARRFRPHESYLSFSQEGEDMVVRSILMDKQPGFYVDVGAHHPDRYSNTAWFYRHGWRGINIEANPELCEKLMQARPRDITLACGVGTEEGELDFFLFSEPAVSTFDPDVAAAYEHRNNDWRVVSRIPVPVRPLAGILHEHVPQGTVIDLLSVDVEGFDFDVLQSNDWDCFAPTVVLVECHGNSCESVSADPVAGFMADRGYVAVAKTFSTVVFMKEGAAAERRSPDAA